MQIVDYAIRRTSTRATLLEIVDALIGALFLVALLVMAGGVLVMVR